jgi:hypothetical protein
LSLATTGDLRPEAAKMPFDDVVAKLQKLFEAHKSYDFS